MKKLTNLNEGVIPIHRQDNKGKFVYYKDKPVYDFELDYEDDSDPRSIMNLCDPIQNKNFKGYVYFFGYRFKEYREVKKCYPTIQEFNTIKHQFREQLKAVKSQNWIGKKLIEKALEKLKDSNDIDVKRYDDIHSIIYPVSKTNLFNNRFVYLICSMVNPYGHAEYKEIETIPMIKNKLHKSNNEWYKKSKNNEEKIWFDIKQLQIDIWHWCKRDFQHLKEKFSQDEFNEILNEEYKIRLENDVNIINKMIKNFNKNGEFKISSFAGKDEVKFRKYFHKYLKFRDFDIYDGEAAKTNILLLGENILIADDINTTDSTLIEMINRVEELIDVCGGDKEDYKIFCFTLIGK